MTSVWLVIRDDGGCGDPDCCGSTSYYYEAYSTKELADTAAGGPYDRVEQLTIDEGVI